MGFNKAHKMAQRLHRERRQPEHRKKLGYLEKKQDYKKRAIDHQVKKEQLRKLKNKALERNPNEFHFHMINSRMVDGVHQDIVKPMCPKVRERIVKKEDLLKRYNQSVITKKMVKSNQKGESSREAISDTAEVTNSSQRRRHIIFTRT